MRNKLAVSGAMLMLSALAAQLGAQQQPLPAFDVASVKPNNSDDPSKSNFPLGPGDVYVTNGGYFTASGFPLATYVAFAYKLIGSEAPAVLAQLPGWASTERFDIQAKTEGDPKKDTKDQMRLMMRSLLADRFKLATHYETREVPVFALTLQKPDKMGPKLQVHPADATCTTVLSPNGPPSPPTGDLGGMVTGGYPTQCGGLLMMPPADGRLRGGARNITMPFIGNLLANMGGLGRPVVDRTGLSGTFDFVLDWAPEPNSIQQLGPDFLPDPNGPSFMDALKNQLGLKLESQKAPSQFLIIDHVEHPTAN